MGYSENEEEERGITKDNSKAINTKEMINLLLNLEALYKHSNKPNYARIMNDCIKAIERGEKFEKMWGEVIRYFGYMEWKDEIIVKIKQKYFPKDEVLK